MVAIHRHSPSNIPRHVTISCAEDDQQHIVGLDTKELCYLDLTDPDVSVSRVDINKVGLISRIDSTINY